MIMSAPQVFAVGTDAAAATLGLNIASMRSVTA
jgi:hypothetical protein